MPEKAEETSKRKETVSYQIFHIAPHICNTVRSQLRSAWLQNCVTDRGRAARTKVTRGSPLLVSADTEQTTEQAHTETHERDDAEQEQERITRNSLADVSSPTHSGGEDGRHIGDDRSDRDSGSSRLDRVPSFRRFQTRGLMIIRTALTMKIKQIRPKR